jgi:hypothetical protein
MTKPNTTAKTQKHPTDPKTLAAALLAWRETSPSAPKNGRNPHFKSSFSNFEDVVECVNTATEYGITWTQTTDFIVVEHGIVDFIVTKIWHVGSGEMVEGRTLIKVKDPTNPQAMGSGITYAKRYGLQAAFGIPSEEDDGNAASKPAAEAVVSFNSPPKTSSNGGQHAEF